MAAKRKSAFSAALREAQQQSSETVKPSGSEAVEQQHSETVQPLEGETATLQYGETEQQLHGNTVTQPQRETVEVKRPKKERKVSFYLTTEQEQKLDDLAYEYNKRTRKRINRNDIVRYLIDQVELIPDDAQLD